MAILRIDKIKNFGVFRDFKWTRETQNFKKHNLFYGWNYSGKTTLARIFACFENGVLHGDYLGAEFELLDDRDNKFNQDNLEQCQNIKVFNIDFVERNLNRFQAGSEIEPFFILGEENFELQEGLKILNEEVIKINEENLKLINDRTGKEKSLRNAYSLKAKHIKETLVLPDYEKRNLESRVEAIKSGYKNYILNGNSYEKLFTIYQDKDQKDNIGLLILPTLKFLTLQDETKNLIGRKISAQKVIEELKNNPPLNSWVKEGKKLHEEKTICQFCGNELPPDLFERLNKHFSEEYTKLEEDVVGLVLKIKKHQEELVKYETSLPDKAILYQEFNAEYENTKTELKAGIGIYNESLNKLIKGLEEKRIRPFLDHGFNELPDPSIIIEKSTGVLIEIINKHNTKKVNFEKEKEDAKIKLIDHFAAEFIEEQDLMSFDRDQKILDVKIEENSQVVNTKVTELKRIESELSDLVKGADKTNEYIQQFFGHDGIKVEITENKKFQLVRNGVVAKNLSEGEKTAISLAYFIARLEEKGTKLDETIVFIDDPVSSLDSNHLFNIYAFIKSKLENCLQLFVSTHNMEFFNLMKDFLKEAGYTKISEMPCFLVQREWNSEIDQSIIIELPKVLKCFRSEYSYLFGLLKEFNEHEEATIEKHRMLYLIPNVARRFLENYLGLRYPDGQSWHKKLDKLITNETERTRIEKLVNEYSHNQSATRALRFPEPTECKEVVKSILDCLVSVDKEHYNALCDGM